MKLTESELRSIIREEMRRDDLPSHVQAGIEAIGISGANASFEYERSMNGEILVRVDYFSEFVEHNVQLISNASSYGLHKIQHVGDGEVVYRFETK